MEQKKARVKRADWVTVDGSSMVGCVQRLARDGNWADVNWGTHTKRMQTRVLQVQTTLQIGEWTVTDITRQNELNGCMSGNS
jgi:hypothetical protein